jgi:hypothetical protein
MHLDGERVKRAVRDAALKINGVAAAFTNTELMIPNPGAAGVELGLRKAFQADRSGEVLATLKRGYLWGGATTGSTHGQFVEEDQHVPVLFWGRGVAPRRYTMQVAPTDIARSVGSLLGVDAGSPDSIILPSMAGGELQAVIRAALAEAPKFERIIPGDKLSAEARSAIAFSALPAEKLPAGYARLDQAEITGDTANVTVWYGPIPPPPPPGVLQLACGTGHRYQLKRDADGTWRIVSRGVVMC